jgi:hypothetical protein
MKKIKYILLTVLGAAAMTACQDLDLEPKGILDEAALFGSEFGVKKYVAGLYDYLPIEDFVYHPRRGYRWDNYWQNAESMAAMDGEASGQFWGVEGAGGFSNPYWPYDRIRDVNTLIEGLPKYEAEFTSGVYKSLLGEAHFLRAFFYFGLVKRYGGIPIVKQVMDPTTSDTLSLFVSRDKEADVYRFIHDDLEFAINNMQETGERGRANKYVAAALMSRTMLYAGSIAKYGGYSNLTGEAVDRGLVGIPAGEAAWFFEESYKASVLIENSGKYKLYEGNADKEQNYVDAFILLNDEDIFVKEYNITAPHNNRLKHSYDPTHLPSPDFSSDNEAATFPVIDLVELYQELPIVNADGTPRRFKDRKDLWKDLEPRMRANFFFSGMTLRDGAEKKEFDIRRGLYVSFKGKVEDAQRGNANAPVNAEDNRILQGPRDGAAPYEYNGTKYTVAGAHGTWKDGHANNTRTGVYIRKYIDYRMSTKDVKLYNSVQPWKVFRFGEILLNHAEAAYELGLLRNDENLKSDAFDQIAKIRNRAGATPHALNSAPGDLSAKYGYPLDENMQYIRDERYRELCFENQRWWDMRRWRIADTYLHDFLPTCLMTYLVLDETKWIDNDTREDSYIFLREDEPWNKRFNFEKKYYYEDIPGNELNKNPNLFPHNPIY